MKSIYSNTITGIIHILSAAAIYLLLNTGCDLLESNKSSNNLQLTVSETSCTEAWLSLKTNQLSLPQEISLIQNEKERETFNLTKRDTLLYLDSLQPNTTYKFKAKVTQSTVTSQTVAATTMDTTSHDFTWETFTFAGDAGSSGFDDCFIVNDTLAYAVGEVYLFDSTGVSRLYNLAEWNGEKWTLRKVSVNFRGYEINPSIEGIFGFSSTDIWLIGSLPIHGDGENWVMYDLRKNVDDSLSLSKAWGSSSDNMYFVGRNGSIAHYSNGTWEKIESGTGLTFYDVWGNVNTITNETEILAVASEVGSGKGSIIGKISNNNFTPVSLEGMTGSASEVWFIPNRAYYIGSGMLYYKHNLADSSWKAFTGLTQFGVTSVHGNDINDVFITSSGGNIVHFNGVSFRSYRNQIGIQNIGYSSITSKSNMIIAVGSLGTQAAITVGRR